MRPFVIVEPDEAFHGSIAVREGPAALEGQALVIDRAKEPLDLAVGLGPPRSQQVMHDAQAATGLLESREAVVVQGMTHGEGQGVVRQYGFDPIRQAAHDLLEEARSGETGLLGRDRDDRLTTKIINGRKFVVVPGISQRRQQLDVDMQQLAWPTLFIAPTGRPPRARQSGLTMAGQHPMHGLRAHPDQRGDPRRSQAPAAPPQDLTHDAWRDGGRTTRATRPRHQPAQPVCQHPVPPARQHLAGNRKFTTQVAQGSAFGVQAHQERTDFSTMGHPSWHEPPPRLIL